MDFDISSWDKRNVGVTPSGELVVRQSFSALANTVFSSTGTALFCHTVKCQTTNENWHYILFQDVDGNTQLKCVDDDFVVIQTFDYDTKSPVRAFSCSTLENMVLFTSPDLPAVFSIIGGTMVLAEKQDSVNPATTAIADIPKGISVSWAGRVVIAAPQGIYFSDALYPLTYVGENVIDPPGGVIYGLHVSAGGALIVITSTGVWALPEDASASGQIVVGIFSKLTDYECTGYNQTAVAFGNVYGLTRKGVRRIDKDGADELFLDEQNVSTELERIQFMDYRQQSRIVGSKDGIFVFISKYICAVDYGSKLKSWWTRPLVGDDYKFAGILQENDGSELFCVSGGVLYQCGNNSLNGTTLSDTSELIVRASVTGRLPSKPQDSLVVRYVSWQSDTHSDFRTYIKGTAKTSTPKRIAPVIDTDLWSVVASNEAIIQSRQTDWAVRSDDLSFQFSLDYYPGKVPQTVNVDFKGPGKTRRV
jgi:hypothetical protein